VKSVGRPSAKERKPYDMDAIVDVAVRVFLQRGYDGASLDQVAEAAGITKASIYYHAEGKEALLARGAGRALDALFAVLEEAAATEGREIDRLKYVLKRTIEITVQRLPEVALLLRVRGNTQTERWILERRRRFDRLVAKIVNRAQARGQIRADIEAGLITRLLFGMLNSITEWYRPGGGLNADDVIAGATRIAFDGLE
jgi:AcrR family transcriptional regulator